MDKSCLAAYYCLGCTRMAERRFDESVAAFENGAALHADNMSLAYLAWSCGLAGQRQRAQALLAELQLRVKSQRAGPMCLAEAYLGLGDHASALEWLERAFEERDTLVLWIRVSPRWDALRDEPRFDQLVRRLPLPPRP